MSEPAAKSTELLWSPQPGPQEQLVACPLPEARGWADRFPSIFQWPQARAQASELFAHGRICLRVRLDLATFVFLQGTHQVPQKLFTLLARHIRQLQFAGFVALTCWRGDLVLVKPPAFGGALR